MKIYQIEKLTVSFSKRRIFYIEALDIEAARITVVHGPSGVGKSTFLRSLNRLNECYSGAETSGSIKLMLDGAFSDIYTIPVELLRRKAGMVFQHPNVLPVSVEKNFTIPLVKGMGIKKKDALEIMREKLIMVGLWAEVASRLLEAAGSLSGGQQQRLCMARALSLAPEILLLDEPTASLDAKAAATVEETIFKIAEKHTVLAVTHDSEQALRLGSNFIDMQQYGFM